MIFSSVVSELYKALLTFEYVDEILNSKPFKYQMKASEQALPLFTSSFKVGLHKEVITFEFVYEILF